MGAVNGLVLIPPTQYSFSYSGTGGEIINQAQISFTAVTNMTFDNIFSKDYDDYVILIRYNGTVNGNWLYVQYRSGGANDTASRYSVQYAYSFYNSSPIAGRALNQTAGYCAYSGSSYNNITQMLIYNPNLPLKTVLRADTGGDFQSTYVESVTNAIITQNNATVFDGIRIYPGSGTITGTMNIYGVRL